MKIEFIRRLIKVVEESNINEIEISRFGTRIKISKNGRVIETEVAKAPGKQKEVKVQENIEEIKEEERKKQRNLTPIKSPMVGTFYRAPAPNAPPFVEVGDMVKPGQTVCIIEAMKLMNEISADIAGRVVEILVKNEEPVEYGQELFLIEPVS